MKRKQEVIRSRLYIVVAVSDVAVDTNTDSSCTLELIGFRW